MDLFTPSSFNLPSSIPFQRWLPYEQTSMLTREVSNEEIEVAIFSAPNNKNLDPDGFMKEFFVFFLDIVGKDLTLVIKHFFDNGKLLRALNHYFLSLISKTLDAKIFECFRPISLYNFV